MAYLLDANVFIQAKNLHYGFDFCPAFWEWLVDQRGKQTVLSISQVGDELLAGDDTLADWTKQRGRDFFAEFDQQAVPALGDVARWATSQQYEPAAINTFLQVADYYLVASAKAHGHVVVTHEVPSDSRKRIKIPNACLGLGVSFVSPYEMLRRERARFVLGR